MKNKLLNAVRTYGCYAAAPFITAVALLAVYVVGGIFPFGDNNVEYYDMAQGIIPGFYHIWDAIHSDEVPLWFNWYSGMGVNNSTASLSLFWLALLVIPRRLVGKAMSLYVVMLFSASAFSACLFLRRGEKASPFFSVVLSLCYAFCGFSVMYYTNAWQDTVFLFPLLMLAWLELMKKGKSLWYIVLVVLNLMCGYYVFLIALFYMFFMSWIYLRLCVNPQIRKDRALTLGASTVLAVGVSAVFLLPKLIQTFSSGRFIERSGFDFSAIIRQYLEIAGTTECKSFDKWAMLFCIALPLAIIILGISKNRKNKKTNTFFVINILLLAVLIVCEGANLMMHFGDYKYFPMRMGYALSFGFIWAGGHYSRSLVLFRAENIQKGKKRAIIILTSVALLFVFFVAVFLSIKKLDAVFEWQYACIFAIPALTVIYLLLLSSKNKIADYRVICSVILAEVTVLSSLFIPYWQTDQLEKEHSPAYISKSQQLVRRLDIEESKTQRIKTIGTTLNCNYGTVMQRATLSDWTHLIPSNVQQSLIALGYSGEYTRLHDSGGTAFTDALLGVTNVLSVKEESTALYDEIAKAGGYHYYSCKYTLPYGVIADKSILDIDMNGADWKVLNNKLYSCISQEEGELVCDGGLTLASIDGNTETYTFKSKPDTTAYFRLEGANGVVVYVNGEKVRIPTVNQNKNAKYPGRFNRNLICLGEFGDSTVEIKLVLKNGKFEDQKDFRQNDKGENAEANKNFMCEVGLLDLNKLEALCTDYTKNSNVTAKNYSLTARVNSAQDKVLFLPLQYNDCWQANVNGESKGVQSVLGVFSAVELTDGKNEISMTFIPTGLKSGAVISIASAVILALCVLLRRKFKLCKLACAVDVLYNFAFFAGVVAVYAVPIILSVLSILKI